MTGFRLVILGSEPWHITKWMCCPVHEFSVICTVSDIAFQGGRTHTEEYICNDCHSYICAYAVFHMLMQHCVAILMSAS